MDDYYPAPTTGFVVCDREGRILAVGRGVFELTGYREGDLMGKEVVEALHLSGFEQDRNPVALALEWGVRQLDRDLELQTATGGSRRVKADVFPAYDEDGGLLVGITPR